MSTQTRQNPPPTTLKNRYGTSTLQCFHLEWEDAPYLPHIYRICKNPRCRLRDYQPGYKPKQMPKINDITGIKVEGESCALWAQDELAAVPSNPWSRSRKKVKPQHYRNEVTAAQR